LSKAGDAWRLEIARHLSGHRKHNPSLCGAGGGGAGYRNQAGDPGSNSTGGGGGGGTGKAGGKGGSGIVVVRYVIPKGTLFLLR
jgi:hypothetical protein